MEINSKRISWQDQWIKKKLVQNEKKVVGTDKIKEENFAVK